jgi:predicted amidophosphoribosyltransferase
MLISCPECTKDVSDTLTTCPHCGFQLEQTSNLSTAPAAKVKRKKKPATLQYLAFAAIIVALFTPRVSASQMLLTVRFWDLIG